MRSFHLIFQAGNSAFLRFTPFFPVVGSVEVSGRFIDRLTKTPNGQISSPQDTRGVVRPFLEPLRLAGRGVYGIMRKVSEKIQDIGKQKE